MNEPVPIAPERELRSYVIRLPGVYLGIEDELAALSYQTVVMAKDMEKAWDLALTVEIWERLPFPVDSIQIFPSNP